jgi:death-on-curing protein
MFGGEFLHGGLHEMAAAYLFHLISNHAFVDGNKRIGAAAAAAFLYMNDLKLVAAEDDYTELCLGIARGELNKTDATIFFRRWSQPFKSKNE